MGGEYGSRGGDGVGELCCVFGARMLEDCERSLSRWPVLPAPPHCISSSSFKTLAHWAEVSCSPP